MKNNRKGFTLVELLAVIVILAILMVSAGAGVMATMNNSKVNTFKNEVLTFIDGANKMYSEVSMSTDDANKFIVSNTCQGESGVTAELGYRPKAQGCALATNSAMCVSLSGLVNNGYVDKELTNYAGAVLVEVPYDGGATKYMIWAHNSVYGVNGIEKSHINKLKFNKTNNDSVDVTDGTTADNGVKKINGGSEGIITDREGIEAFLTGVYGVNTAKGFVDALPTTAGGGVESAQKNELETFITSSKEHGGTGNVYKIKCVNVKLT